MEMAFDNKHWCYDRMKCFDFNGETHVLLKHFQLNSTSNLRQSIGFSIFIPRTREKYTLESCLGMKLYLELFGKTKRLRIDIQLVI